MAKKPEIVLFCQNAKEDLVREICAGIEEERVPFRRSDYDSVNNKKATSIEQSWKQGAYMESFLSKMLSWDTKNPDEKVWLLAREAAKESTLSVGIGMIGNSIALTHESLAENKIILEVKYANKNNARLFGKNSARLVKKLPMQIEEINSL